MAGNPRDIQANSDTPQGIDSGGRQCPVRSAKTITLSRGQAQWITALVEKNSAGQVVPDTGWKSGPTRKETVLTRPRHDRLFF